MITELLLHTYIGTDYPLNEKHAQTCSPKKSALINMHGALVV
jgi:hypothetical protein